MKFGHEIWALNLSGEFGHKIWGVSLDTEFVHCIWAVSLGRSTRKKEMKKRKTSPRLRPPGMEGTVGALP